VKHYRRILGYVRPYRGVFAIAIVGMLLVASTDVMLLKIVQPLLNNVGAIDADSVWWLPYSIVGVFVLRGLGSYASEYGLAWIGSRVVFDLRCEACDRLLRLADGVLRRDVGGLPAVADHRSTRSRSPPRPRKRSP
jgi:subfamily B ATP-binding cassette protein MsbA